MTHEERETLILANIEKARVEAKKVYRRLPKYLPMLSMEDLTQAAFVGLIQAIDTWNPAKGALTTLIGFRARGAVLDYVRSISHFNRQTRSNPEFLQIDQPTRAKRMAGGAVTSFDALESMKTMHVELEDQSTVNRDAEGLVDLRKYMRLLPRREKKVLHQLFYLGLSIKEACPAGRHESRISQLKNSAIRTLRERMAA